jgi:FkbM family methyltransferase
MLALPKQLLIKAMNWFGYDFVRLQDATGITLINVLALVVRDYLARNPACNFTFVQIGANDGVRADPLHNLIADNWRGVLVEPIPAQFDALKRNNAHRSNLQFEMSVITDYNGRATLYCSNGTDYESCYSSIDKGAVLTSQKMIHGIEGTKVIPIDCNAMTLGALFTKYDVERLDLLVVDTEGHDYGIVRQLLDKTTVRPGIIQYEHGFMTREKEHECRALLAKAGYDVLAVGVDTIGVKKTTASA